MATPQVVLDTNIIISGLRSRRGASARVLDLVGRGLFEINLSVPLLFEYESVLRRQLSTLEIDEENISELLDFHCRVGNPRSIFYLWRPSLPDPRDELILELAVTAQCDYIVSYNKRDFAGVERFGIQVVDARELLQLIGELS